MKTHSRVTQLAMGYIASAALHLVLKLKIADRLVEGPQSVDVLAQEAGVKAEALVQSTSSLGRFRCFY